MGLEQHLHPDGLQYLLVGVCVFDMIFFSYYLFAYELLEQSTISDSLFTRVEYAAVLSITLTIRLTGAVMYFVRYRFQDTCGWLVTGFVGVSLTFFGWCVLFFYTRKKHVVLVVLIFQGWSRNSPACARDLPGHLCPGTYARALFILTGWDGGRERERSRERSRVIKRSCSRI